MAGWIVGRPDGGNGDVVVHISLDGRDRATKVEGAVVTLLVAKELYRHLWIVVEVWDEIQKKTELTKQKRYFGF